jgi:hypothetical protein
MVLPSELTFRCRICPRGMPNVAQRSVALLQWYRARMLKVSWLEDAT